MPTQRPQTNPILRHLLLLTALCWGVYCIGLTSHGLTNWQEAQRAIVAREMQERAAAEGVDAWIAPTVDGRAYLAKPPMMYWWQLGLAELRGVRTGEFELRLTVALAGWLGVLATYLVGRRMLRDSREAEGAQAAVWGAAFLATGLLYVRSARIGELDILLVPFTVVAIGAIFEAWRSHLVRRRTDFAAVGVAAIAAAGAALTKGPPGVLVIGIAAYGGIQLWHGLNPLGSRGIGARVWQSFVAFSRTHPVGVLGVGLAAYFGWLYLAGQALGGVAEASFEAEASDNLRLFVAKAPMRNLSTASYGVGVGSLACLGALVWLVRRRVRLDPALCVLLAWVVGGLLAFSVLGKGVPRYLTPLFPGMAILGGLWWARTWPLLPRPRIVRGAVIVLVIGLGVGQSAWYGYGREFSNPERSPRAMVEELLSIPGISADRLAMFEFDTPAIDYYAGRRVDSYRDATPRPALVGVGEATTDDLKREIAVRGPMVLLVRLSQPERHDPGLPIDRLRNAGLMIEPIPLTTRFVIDNNRSEIAAVRASVPS